MIQVYDGDGEKPMSGNLIPCESFHVTKEKAHPGYEVSCYMPDAKVVPILEEWCRDGKVVEELVLVGRRGLNDHRKPIEMQRFERIRIIGIQHGASGAIRFIAEPC